MFPALRVGKLHGLRRNRDRRIGAGLGHPAQTQEHLLHAGEDAGPQVARVRAGIGQRSRPQRGRSARGVLGMTGRQHTALGSRPDCAGDAVEEAFRRHFGQHVRDRGSQICKGLVDLVRTIADWYAPPQLDQPLGEFLVHRVQDALRERTVGGAQQPRPRLVTRRQVPPDLGRRHKIAARRPAVPVASDTVRSRDPRGTRRPLVPAADHGPALVVHLPPAVRAAPERVRPGRRGHRHVRGPGGVGRHRGEPAVLVPESVGRRRGSAVRVQPGEQRPGDHLPWTEQHTAAAVGDHEGVLGLAVVRLDAEGVEAVRVDRQRVERLRSQLVDETGTPGLRQQLRHVRPQQGADRLTGRRTRRREPGRADQVEVVNGLVQYGQAARGNSPGPRRDRLAQNVDEPRSAENRLDRVRGVAQHDVGASQGQQVAAAVEHGVPQQRPEARISREHGEPAAPGTAHPRAQVARATGRRIGNRDPRVERRVEQVEVQLPHRSETVVRAVHHRRLDHIRDTAAVAQRPGEARQFVAYRPGEATPRRLADHAPQFLARSSRRRLDLVQRPVPAPISQSHAPYRATPRHQRRPPLPRRTARRTRRFRGPSQGPVNEAAFAIGRGAAYALPY